MGIYVKFCPVILFALMGNIFEMDKSLIPDVKVDPLFSVYPMPFLPVHYWTITYSQRSNQLSARSTKNRLIGFGNVSVRKSLVNEVCDVRSGHGSGQWIGLGITHSAYVVNIAYRREVHRGLGYCVISKWAGPRPLSALQRGPCLRRKG